MGKLRQLCALALALAVLPTALFAQERGTVSGQVVDQETGNPIASAQIVLQGTALRTVTDGQGRYTLRNVPAGRYTITASQLGRETSNQPVTVASGQTATVNFRLRVSAVAIEGLVIRATGEEQRAREVGNSVPKINVGDDVPLASVNDVTQVLQGRAAGVSVLQSGGTAGTGARIRIRGSNSVSLSNDPLLIIDGARAESGNQGIGVGGQTASRFSDLNPEEIESIEVLKGPSASALYGTAAANGVIVVTTKKGRAGRTRFNFYSELGNVRDVADYPANATGWCSFATSPTTRANFSGCHVSVQGNPTEYGVPADTRLDSIQAFNPLEDPRSTPFETGVRRKVGLSASGGSEQATYFLSGDLEDEGGVYKFDLNDLTRRSVRANIRGQLSNQLDVTVNTGYVNSEIRLPQNDNNALGVVSGALLSTRVAFDSVSQGYGFNINPSHISKVDTRNVVDRLIGSAQANYRPLGWLSITGQAGVDRVSRLDVWHVPPQQVPYNTTYLEGLRQNARTGASNYTANLNGTATFNLGPSLTANTSVGTQYNEEISRQVSGYGEVLLAGVTSLEGLTARFDIDEANFQVRTIGAYITQQFGLNDRLFLTGALRTDRNSAFGNDFGWVVYPSLSASWVVAEEPWFPQLDLLSTLRLRAAYGSSGLRPGVLDAFQFLDPVAVRVSTTSSVPGFTVGGAGNPRLRPEKSSELEMGLDAGLFEDRLGLELTYFNKVAEDALVNVRLAPSLGVSATRRENLGSVRNKGFEMLLNARIVESSRFRWDATVSAARIDNELETLGDVVSPIIFGLGGASQRHTPGRPLGAYFARPYTFADANNDGRIDFSEINFTSDTNVYAGNPFPSREASFQTNLQLFEWIRVSGLLDYRGGFKQFNSTTEFRCGSFAVCPEIYDPSTSLEEQAAGIASLEFDSWWGYIEDASFVKLREVSVTLGLPRSLAERLRTQGLSLTLAGRNLKTWTDYRGLDPEINYAGTGSNFNTAEFLTQPPARYFTARLDVSF